MWKAAFGGRSERGGSTVGVDDTASTSSRRRRHRRSSNDDKSMVSSTSRRTDSDRKRHSRHESGVSYGSAPIPRLTESAVNAFNANDDDDDIWEDEADLKSERRSKVSDGHERRRRKSSGRSERSRSRERDSSSKHKKSSGRSERSRSRERDGWTRKSNGRTERSRSRERDDRDRRRKDEDSSRLSRPNGKSVVSEISKAPSSYSIDQYPSVLNPSTVRFEEHTMSGALDSHVPNQFPGQNPSTYAKSDFEPNPHGAAADYYNDKGQSVKYQPGERAYTPNPSSVAAPSGSTKPTKPAKSTKQSSSSSSSAKPSKKSSRAVSPPTPSAIIPAAAIGGAAAAANHHMQARASTQYEPSIISQNDYVHDRPAPSAVSGPIRYNSEPPPTVGAASGYYEPSEITPSMAPTQSGMYPSSQVNKTGKYAAAGAAAAGMAAYGMSQHNQQSEYHQRTSHTQFDQRTEYTDDGSRFGPPPSYGPGSQYGAQPGPQAPFTPQRPGQYYDSAPGTMETGMHHHHHEHRGPISRLKDGFLNLLSSPEDVAKMEEYTEYIGVCKHCFDPRSSPYAGPRKHHYHPKKKDSFETMRRRSYERLQRRRSDESIRRTNSKVQKENRYYSSDQKSSSNAKYMAGGLAVAGAAAAGASMFNDRKGFDDTYSVKSGHRASSAVRRRGSNSSFESTRRRTSRGRVSSSGHEEFITVRTKDGRVENRKVHRSRSGSTGRKSNWIGSAAGGAALGAAGAAATSRHRRRSSPDQVSLRHGERRYSSRSSSRSHSPGLGEIFGFTESKPRRSRRRSPFGSYQDSRVEQQKRKEKGGFFTFSNGSASSSDSGMAFGDINGSALSRRSSGRSTKSNGKRKVSKKSSDEKLKSTLLGIGATAAALTAAQKLSKSPKPGPRPSLGARRDARVSQYGPEGHKKGPPGSSDEGEWIDELPSDASSDESALAFDDGNVRRRLSSRPSMDSVGSSSSNDGLSAWGWRWGSKKEKKRKQRPASPPHHEQQSMPYMAPTGPPAAIMPAGAVFDVHGRRVPSDVGLVETPPSSQAPMQFIDPKPLSDAGSRHPSMPGAFEDPPLQSPQPIAPFQPAFTQGSPEDPLKPIAGPSSKPPMRRSASSPTRNSKGSFMGDAAFIGGAAVATAGIIASQNRKGSPGSVRFGLNDEQQKKFDREIREEREREDIERRKADRTRALKEEAERFAREEDEKRALAERKRQQQEEEERERQRQLESNQREEAYRREQAEAVEKSRRRAEEERQAAEEERQRANDRQIREELERKQMEREERSRKKKDRSTDERSQASPSSWKGPVAAGMAGAVAGAVLDGALHKQGREYDQEEPRSRDAYSTQTFEPTNEHSGAPITDDDLADPDFFKRKRSPADLRRYEELSNEKLEELFHDHEDYYNMPAQSQKDFFMPKELLEKQAEGKERSADPYGDNEVDVYQTTGGEARHIQGGDFGKYGKPPVVHQNIPKLNVIAPTPPQSTAGSVRGDKSAPPSPLAEIQDATIPEGADEKARHVPGGFDDPVYSDQQQPGAVDTQESAWEPPLSKKDKKKRDKAAKRESAFDSEPATPQEEVIQDVPATRSVSFDAPQEEFEAPISKKDKKKKGKKDKQASTFDDEPVIPAVVEAEPESMTTVEPPVAEEEFTPLSKKDKKKKAKKGMSFDDSEPTTPAPESPRADPYFVPDASQDRSIDAFHPVTEPVKENDDFQPLSKKDKKKKGKKSLAFEDSEPTTPVNEPAQLEPEVVAEAPQAEPESAWEPPLSKKEKKKREKEAKQGLAFDSSEPTTPANEPAEPLTESRELDAEAAWEPPLSKKDKKKRDKEAKSASGLDASEPGTLVNELEQGWVDPVAQEAEATFEPPLSKKEKKKREKEAQRQSLTFGDSPSETPANELNDPLVQQSRELDADPLVSSQEVSAEPEWEPPLSKKDKKKREKEAQRQSLSLDDAEPKPATDDFGGVELEREPETEAPWEPPLSKKDKKKRDKEAKSQGFGDIAAAVMTTAGVAAIADAVSKSEDDDYSTGKKSKKDKKKSTSFDEGLQSEAAPSDMPGSWDESSSDAAKDPPAADRDIPRAATTSPSQENAADDLWGSSDTKKSKKKKKRESGRFSEPAIGSPLRSEIAFDDYLGDAASANGDAQSTGYGRGGRGPSYYDDDYPKTGSPRNMSPDGMAHSVVSAPSLERRKSSKSKSKRRSGAYDGPEDFDDTRSIHSTATEPATSSSKKEKKGGLFGLFSRKSSDGDKRDQSFLGERVEDLPPLPLSRQTSAISAPAQEEQDHGTPASAEAVDQAVTVDPVPQGASTPVSYHTEPVVEGGNTDIWGDPMGDVSQQPDLGEDVWGDEEFADRPSLPREVAAEQSLDATAAEGATPSRTGGPMTNIQDDFDDWFGSTDPTPKAPLLVKGKKGKKAKKGKAAQAKSSAPSSPVTETAKEEAVTTPTDLQETPVVQEILKAEQTEDLLLRERDLSAMQTSSNEPTASQDTQTVEVKAQDDKHTESAVVDPAADAPTHEHVEELSAEQLSTRRPSATPRPLSSTAIPLRFKPIPSSPSMPKERSLSFGSPVEAAPMSPLSATGSTKKPRPRSSEFREVRPLYLVSRNSKLEDVEEQLPTLPDSKPSSRASSVQGSEDWHSAAENISPQPDLFESPGGRRNLTIDLDEANKYRTEDEIMDTADQTTPKASDFPHTALLAPRSHSKQVPQFYTWEDLAKDEEMHEAAARQAEGVAEPETNSSRDAVPAEGLGIEQVEDQPESDLAPKTKKDKRKNKKKGLAAAALLAGGAALAMESDNVDNTQNQKTADEPDAAVDQAEQPTTAEAQDPTTVATEAPRDVSADTPAAVPDEAADDFFAPTTTKKSKKAKKNKKAQTSSDEPEEPAPAEQAPASDIPTEGAAAEYYAATEDAMAKEQETPVANNENAETAGPSATEPAPAEVEWAALTTSKKGKKAKKGKKQKADAWAEPESEQSPVAEGEIVSEAAATEVYKIVSDKDNAATVTPSDDKIVPSDVVPESVDASGEKDLTLTSKTIEPAAEPVPEKDAAAASSRGWFSWPWGAKKAAEEGLEVDPVTMQAREMPQTATDPTLEAVEVKEPLESLAQEKVSDAAVPEPAARDASLPTDTIKDTPSVDLMAEIEPLGEKQDVIPAAKDHAPQVETPTETAEAEDLWGAPTSKKKKGKKGKKSGQSTPLLLDELPEAAKVEEPAVVDKDTSDLQEPATLESEATQPVDAQPAEEDSFWVPQPSKKKKGKKGKKSEELVEQIADTPAVEAESTIPEATQEQSSAPETASAPVLVDPVEEPKDAVLEEVDTLSASQPTKKKGKKNKKASASSTPWDELVAEEAPLEGAPDQAGTETPTEPRAESQEGAADDPVAVEAGTQDSTQPAGEPEAEDMWAALPAKKKGKKGKKAAKDAVAPSQDDEPQATEVPLADDAVRSLGDEPSGSTPSEQVEPNSEQPVPDLPTEQETPAAEPEDFWAPQPKGKKGKKGKKGRQDAVEEAPVPSEPEATTASKAAEPEAPAAEVAATDALPTESVPEPTPDAPAPTEQDDILVTKDSDNTEPLVENIESSAAPAETAQEPMPEAAKEVVEDDFWGEPAKGKKAKKGKKKKGGLDLPGTPPPETIDNVPESQPGASDDVPAEVPQDVVPMEEAVPVPEQTHEQEAAPEDDWSALTTSKKGKKAKKSKKAAAVEESVTEAPAALDSEAKGGSDAPPTVGNEESKDKDVSPEILNAVTTSDAVNDPGLHSASAEPVDILTADTIVPSEKSTHDADPSLVKDTMTAEIAADANEVPATEEATELEPVSAKKSKKDKKKNKKSKALDPDEPSDPASPSVEEIPTTDESAQVRETGEADLLEQDVSKGEAEVTPAEGESKTVGDEPISSEPLPAEQPEDFGSFSTKKSKKDKKKAKKGKATELEDLPTPSTPQEGAAADYFAGESTEPVSAIDETPVVATEAEGLVVESAPAADGTPAVAPVTEGAAADYYAGHPDNVETAAEKDLSADQTAEIVPDEEFGTSSKKSKKDKKKAKKTAASSWDFEEPSTLAPAEDEQPSTAAVEDVQPKDAEPVEADPVDEFGAVSAKSKKDKKKAKKSAASPWDMPEEEAPPTPGADETAPAATAEEGQLADAEPAEVFGAFSSKKSKKDKKKAKKNASLDANDQDGVIPAEATIQPEPESKVPGDAAPDASEQVADSSAEPTQVTEGERDFGLLPEDIKPDTPEGNPDEDLSFSTKKSKKDKKKGKKAKGAVFEDLPEQTDTLNDVPTEVQPAVDENIDSGVTQLDRAASTTEPLSEATLTAPVDNTSAASVEPGSAPADPIRAFKDTTVSTQETLAQEPATQDASPREGTAIDVPQDDAATKDDAEVKVDDFEAIPTKKSKKDKKKAKKGQSVFSAWDEPEPATPVDETPRGIDAPVGNVDEAPKTTEDIAPASGAMEVADSPAPAPEDGDALVPDTSATQDDAEAFSSSTTKKSKKDKKKAKKGIASWDEPEASTPSLETPIDTVQPVEISDEAPKTLENLTADDPIPGPPETTSEQPATIDPSPAQDDTDYFGAVSTKKSKKDKKKAKKASPWDEEPATVEPAVDQPSNEQDNLQSNERSIDTNQDQASGEAPVQPESLDPSETPFETPAETPFETPAETPAETPSEEVSEAFGSFSTKKSKKDKKKGKKAQEADWQTEEIAPATPVDQEVPAVSSGPEESITKEAESAGDVVPLETASQPQEVGADDIWAAPAKKSKKDKKKGKKAQVEEEIAPAADSEVPADMTASLPDQDPPASSETIAPLTTEPETLAAAEAPQEEDDAWGSISTKKSKKDKKKSKKSKVTDEDAVDDQTIVPPVNTTAAEDPASAEHVETTRELPEDASTEIPSDTIAEVEKAPQALDQTTELASEEQRISEDIAPASDTRGLQDATLDEPKDKNESVGVSDTPGQDIDFAATLAAGLADSGFDPNLVVDDPVFHRRASPPSGVAEADPEEIFTSSSKKKKKGKGKKAQDAFSEDAPVLEASSPAADAPDDFDAALSQGLKDSGFDPSLLGNAGSPTQEAISAAIKDDDEEFSFTKSNKKKKKGKKNIGEAEDAPSPAAESSLDSEQQPPQEDAMESSRAVKNGDLDSNQPSIPVPAIEASREPETPAFEEPQTAISSEAIEAGDDEWAAPSKSKKKSKMDKKKQDRSLDIDEPVPSAGDALQGPDTNETPEAQKVLDSVLDATPVEAPIQTEGTAEEEWGAPSKKKKGKKGKKQQEIDWEASDSVATPLETPAAAVIANEPQDPFAASEQSRDIASVEETPLETSEQPSQIVDDEWAAPSKKKKGKKGKKQQDADVQDENIAATPTETTAVLAEIEKQPEVLPSTDLIVPPVADTESSSRDNVLAAEPEPQAPPADDEWGQPSKKKKGKKGKKQGTSDWQETQDPETPGVDEAIPAIATVDEPTESSRDIAETFESAIDNNVPPLEPLPAIEPVTEETSADPAIVAEPADHFWGATSKKKKGKKGKKSQESDLPDDNALAPEVVDPLLTTEDTTSVDKQADVEPANTESAGEQLATAANTEEPRAASEAMDDEWAAPSKKKDKKNKKKKAMDWSEPDNASQDVSRDLAEDPVIAPAEPLDESATLARSADVANNLESSMTLETITGVAETAEDEWAAPSKKKKGKKGMKAEDTWAEPETPVAEVQTVAPDVAALESAHTAQSEDPAPLSRDIGDELAAESPAPAETAADSWDLPVKKKGKKGKKAQLWSEAEPESSVATPVDMPELRNIDNSIAEPTANVQAEVPAATERGLIEDSQDNLTPAPDATAEQPTAIADEEWGTSNKKKGKKSKKKGVISDADLDPFISTPIESSAPISTTDTAEASAVEDVGPTADDPFQPAGEMDIDEMDKAYKAYKKNKRKQKKLQAASGDDNGSTNDQTPEQGSEQLSTNHDLDVAPQTEPTRQPSPLASEEPTWSFAKLEEKKPSGDTGPRLSKVPSHGSLTSRRSLEPLHLDTASPPVADASTSQKQEQQQPEAQGSAHGRSASRDTPLEPTSRQRASYLFQSPAPFQESGPDNASNLRTPEQRGDASDYFHSRGVEASKDAPADGPFSPPAGPMSPRSALHPIPEEHAAHKRSLGDATNITPMEPAGKMLRRTETPKAIREQSLHSATSRDGPGSSARSVSNPMSALGPFDEDRPPKRIVSDTRSPSAMSSRSNLSLHQHVSPEERRTLSRASNRSVTPTLRRTNLSGDLRAASRTSNRRGDAGSAVGARASPKTIPFEPPPTPPLNDEDELDPGATRAAGMAETFQGYGGQQASQVSPTRPPSMRKRQSMHVMDLETKLEQLTSENRALQEAQQSRGMEDVSFDANSQALQQTLESRELELREKNNEIQHIQAMLEPMQQELNRLVQINNGLTEANRNLVDDNNGRFATLQNEHANVTQQWQNTTRELEDMRQEHSRLSSGMRDAVAAQLSTALAEKDHEIRKLKDELAEASERIRALQVQIQSSKTTDFLSLRDEDYFDGACQKLCQHVQQWVLRFSKMSDNRICRLSSDLKDEKIEARLDNALLDGMDVDKLLGDRVRRRDVFMSVVMTMVWEYVFTRYLFGMDREQRQKLKALEKTLSEVGPPRAVAQWRATTLTLLSKRPSFSKQCALDTEAVAHEIFGVLSALLTPPSGSEQQLLTSLTKVITVAVNLSVEMRTQRSEYIMLPPLQPEYDTNGDLVRKVHFNASLMNERSGLFTSNEALESERAVVKIVLFPLVVKKGDEYGEGEEEIVVCPAQVLVHNDSGKSRKVVRVMSGAMEIDDPRRSRQSLLSGRGSMQF